MAKIYCKYYTYTVQSGWESYHARMKLIDCWLWYIMKTYTISIFKIPEAKSGMPEHKNGKKIMWTSIF